MVFLSFLFLQTKLLSIAMSIVYFVSLVNTELDMMILLIISFLCGTVMTNEL